MAAAAGPGGGAEVGEELAELTFILGFADEAGELVVLTGAGAAAGGSGGLDVRAQEADVAATVAEGAEVDGEGGAGLLIEGPQLADAVAGTGEDDVEAGLGEDAAGALDLSRRDEAEQEAAGGGGGGGKWEGDDGRFRNAFENDAGAAGAKAGPGELTEGRAEQGGDAGGKVEQVEREDEGSAGGNVEAVEGRGAEDEGAREIVEAAGADAELAGLETAGVGALRGRGAEARAGAAGVAGEAAEEDAQSAAKEIGRSAVGEAEGGGGAEVVLAGLDQKRHGSYVSVIGFWASG